MTNSIGLSEGGETMIFCPGFRVPISWICPAPKLALTFVNGSLPVFWIVTRAIVKRLCGSLKGSTETSYCWDANVPFDRETPTTTPIVTIAAAIAAKIILYVPNQKIIPFLTFKTICRLALESQPILSEKENNKKLGSSNFG